MRYRGVFFAKCCPKVMSSYETATMFAFQTSPLGVELFFMYKNFLLVQ